MSRPPLSETLAGRRRPLVELLSEWVAIPSVSTSAEHAGDVRRSAEFLRKAALEAGFTTAEVWETGGGPAVYAERLESPELPTVLVYGHHDVQPVDPVSEWELAPFVALERDGLLLGRGTADDKGHMVMHLQAVRALLDAEGSLPINLKLIVEGEEENGSEHFPELVASHREQLRADVAVISDTGMLAEDLPALTVALRGVAYWELRLRTAATDLHSGVYGGAVLNPIAVLAQLLSQLHDADHRISVPGFYDEVPEMSGEERAELATVPFDESSFLGGVGAIGGGESGYSVYERRTVRPTLEFCGIWGGYQEEGAKTVIPARAAAKLSSRMVPNQTAEHLSRVLESHLRKLAPEGVDLELELIHAGRWALTPSSHPAVELAASAVAEVWGRQPVFIREGGSIPPVATIAEELEVPCVLFGVGLPGDRIHAPNERVVLEQLFKGIAATALLWQRYGAAGRLGLRPAS